MIIKETLKGCAKPLIHNVKTAFNGDINVLVIEFFIVLLSRSKVKVFELDRPPPLSLHCNILVRAWEVTLRFDYSKRNNILHFHRHQMAITSKGEQPKCPPKNRICVGYRKVSVWLTFTKSNRIRLSRVLNGGHSQSWQGLKFVRSPTILWSGDALYGTHSKIKQRQFWNQ